MTRLVTVQPAPGLHIRAQDGTPIPEAGMDLPHDLYVQRRLDAGELLLVAPAAPATTRTKERG